MKKDLLPLELYYLRNVRQIYIYKPNSGTWTIEVVIDDLQTWYSSRSLLGDFNSEMEKLFKVRVLGKAKYFVGFDLMRDKKGIKVTQSRHIEDTARKGCGQLRRFPNFFAVPM